MPLHHACPGTRRIVEVSNMLGIVNNPIICGCSRCADLAPSILCRLDCFCRRCGNIAVKLVAGNSFAKPIRFGRNTTKTVTHTRECKSPTIRRVPYSARVTQRKLSIKRRRPTETKEAGRSFFRIGNGNAVVHTLKFDERCRRSVLEGEITLMLNEIPCGNIHRIKRISR